MNLFLVCDFLAFVPSSTMQLVSELVILSQQIRRALHNHHVACIELKSQIMNTRYLHSGYARKLRLKRIPTNRVSG